MKIIEKIKLNDDESSALENFARSGQQAYPVLKKIFKHYIGDLESVRNIDSKGNMGLQALARQNALESLEEIEEQIFPDVAPARRKPEPGDRPPISQYR